MNVIPGRVPPFTEGTVVTTGKDTGKVVLPKDPPMIIPGSVTVKGEIVAPLPSKNVNPIIPAKVAVVPRSVTVLPVVEDTNYLERIAGRKKKEERGDRS